MSEEEDLKNAFAIAWASMDRKRKESGELGSKAYIDKVRNYTKLNDKYRKNPQLAVINSKAFRKIEEEEHGGHRRGNNSRGAILKDLEELLDNICDAEVYVQVHKENPWLEEEEEYSAEDMLRLIRFGPLKNKKSYLKDLDL